MGAQLNIKSQETRRLAEQLAAESGESITKAVTEAIRERLQTIRRERGVTVSEMKEREGAFDAIVKGSRALWRKDLLNGDYNDLLYDDRGLPH